MRDKRRASARPLAGRNGGSSKTREKPAAQARNERLQDKGVQDNENGQNMLTGREPDRSFEARDFLRGILTSGVNAHAKAAAARTLAEIDGLVGKHSLPPDRRQDVPVAGLSRADLVHELTRLRALVRVV